MAFPPPSVGCSAFKPPRVWCCRSLIRRASPGAGTAVGGGSGGVSPESLGNAGCVVDLPTTAASQTAGFCLLGDSPAFVKVEEKDGQRPTCVNRQRLALCRPQTDKAEGGCPPPSCLGALRRAEIIES